MKNVILSVAGLALLAGCSGYDYYETDLRYRQDGKDCIYYYGEQGDKFSEDIRSLKDAKEIVYRNTRCSDLYRDDTFNYERNDRRAVVPVSVAEARYAEEAKYVEPVYIATKYPEVKKEPKANTTTPCGCNKNAKKQNVNKSRYIIVPAYVD